MSAGVHHATMWQLLLFNRQDSLDYCPLVSLARHAFAYGSLGSMASAACQCSMALARPGEQPHSRLANETIATAAMIETAYVLQATKQSARVW